MKFTFVEACKKIKEGKRILILSLELVTVGSYALSTHVMALGIFAPLYLTLGGH
jgi:hypothetical protein